MAGRVVRLIECGLVFTYTLRPNYTGYLGAMVYIVVGEYNILLYKLLRLYMFELLMYQLTFLSTINLACQIWYLAI